MVREGRDWSECSTITSTAVSTHWSSTRPVGDAEDADSTNPASPLCRKSLTERRSVTQPDTEFLGFRLVPAHQRRLRIVLLARLAHDRGFSVTGTVSGEYLPQMGSSFQDCPTLRLGQVREDKPGVSKGSFAEGPASSGRTRARSPANSSLRAACDSPTAPRRVTAAEPIAAEQRSSGAAEQRSKADHAAGVRRSQGHTVAFT